MPHDGLSKTLLIVVGGITLLGLISIAGAAFPKFKRNAKARSLDLSAAPPALQAKVVEAFQAPTFDEFLRESSRAFRRVYTLTNRRDFEAERERTGRVCTAVFHIRYNGIEREVHIHLDAEGIPIGVNVPRSSAS